MSLGARIAWDDMVLPFQLDRADIRGRVARLDDVLDRIVTRHAYPEPVARLVAEATLLTALIGQAVKLRWKLSLQVRGDGPVRLIATDYFGPAEDGAPARMRAYAGYDRAAPLGPNAFGLLGSGFFGILIDQGPGTRTYQGITPLAGGSLSSCAETYFAQSEQLPTRFHLALAPGSGPDGSPRWRAGGVMVQQLPSGPATGDLPSGPDGLMGAEDMLGAGQAEAWRRVGHLLSTAEADELVGPEVTADRLLVRLFHEEAPRVFDAQPIRFGCTCGPEKVEETLTAHSPAEIAAMRTDTGEITADCQFCGARYVFDADQLIARAGRRA